MKRVATLLLGLAMLMSFTGCYCYSPWMGGAGYPYGGGGGACGPGGCAPGATFAPQTGYYQSYDTIQAGVPFGPAPIAVAPVHPATAFAPLDSLPTYR